MKAESVSFGKVVVIAGKPAKVNRVKYRLYPLAEKGNVYLKDVTNQYVNVPINGLLSRSARNGDRIELIVTGREDVQKVKNKVKDWDSIGGILSNMSDCISMSQLSVKDAIKRILHK